MERFIRNDADFKRLFNCSFYNISKIPLEERVNVPLGTFWLTVCSVETVSDLCKLRFCIFTLYIIHKKTEKHFPQKIVYKSEEQKKQLI